MSKVSNENKDAYRQVVAQLKDVIHNSLLVEEHRDRVKGKDGERRPENDSDVNIGKVQRLYGAFAYNGNVYRVKSTIRVFTNDSKDKLHGYDIIKIELIEPERDAPNGIGDNRAKSNNSISLAILLKDVELSYKKGVKVLDAMKNAHDNLHSETEGTKYSLKNDSEIEQIVADAKANGTYLKAPNGQPTNLNPKQWDRLEPRNLSTGLETG